MSKKKTLYEILGLKRDATKEEIDAAKKLKAKELHPDKQGGDEEEFTAMMNAHKLLSDDNARDRYDRTGQTNNKPSFEDQFMVIVNGVMANIIAQPFPQQIDIIETFKKNIKANIEAAEIAMDTTDVTATKIIEVQKRLKYKGKGRNVIMDSLDLQLDQCNIDRNTAEDQLEFGKKAYDFIKDYDCEVDIQEQLQAFTLRDHRVMSNDFTGASTV